MAAGDQTSSTTKRVALCSAAPIQQALRETVEWAQNTKRADGNRVIDAEWVQLNLARVHARSSSSSSSTGTSRRRPPQGGSPSPADASATKVFGTEFATEAYRLLMEVLGPAATLTTDLAGRTARRTHRTIHRSSLILTFGGGTNEIQRDIISMLALRQPAQKR